MPDPNRFGGPVKHAQGRRVDRGRDRAPYADGNYRSIGAGRHGAWRSAPGRPHRASGELALHVLEVMEAFATLFGSGRMVAIETPARAAGAAIAESLEDGRLA